MAAEIRFPDAAGRAGQAKDKSEKCLPGFMKRRAFIRAVCDEVHNWQVRGNLGYTRLCRDRKSRWFFRIWS